MDDLGRGEAAGRVGWGDANAHFFELELDVFNDEVDAFFVSFALREDDVGVLHRGIYEVIISLLHMLIILN